MYLPTSKRVISFTGKKVNTGLNSEETNRCIYVLEGGIGIGNCQDYDYDSSGCDLGYYEILDYQDEDDSFVIEEGGIGIGNCQDYDYDSFGCDLGYYEILDYQDEDDSFVIEEGGIGIG
ncbi:MAG: hypothetical protein EZS28_037197 [Streblomastix strix]|uniref:Uncharacterized protein n=1 Tax=Streblomastix strix TaxID=222440 RepID=A0A5J4U8Q5_9EUKA|nr:MAG: hypothetical protein EZS28_037197 [Streblomastix strix]